MNWFLTGAPTSAFFAFMQKYCFNYGWGQLELQVRKVAHQNVITHSLTLRSLKLLHCSNLHTDSPGCEDCEQWSPLAKFFWKPDSLTLCGCSCGHICRTGGEWNWMQSFPPLPTLLFKMSLSVRSSRRQMRKASLQHIGHWRWHVPILQLYSHHLSNTWTADSRELLLGVGFKKRDKASVHFNLHTHACDTDTERGTACLFLLTSGVVFPIKTVLVNPSPCFQITKHACGTVMPYSNLFPLEVLHKEHFQ